MALEDEIINIDQLDVAKEIQVGDLILIETTDGTKLIDFKDFIIGTDNITFYDKLSALETGDDVDTGTGTLLKASNIEALSSKYTYHESLLSSISAINNTTDNLDSQLSVALASIGSLAAQIDANVSVASYTTSKIGFAAARYSPETKLRSVSFTEEVFTGSSLTSGYNLSVAAANNTNTWKYTAVGIYTLHITGFLTFKTEIRVISDKITLLKNDRVIADFRYEDVAVNHEGGDYRFYTIPLATVVKLEQGDVLTFKCSGRQTLLSGNIAGTII